MAAPVFPSDPCAVAETLLARTGEAYMTGDFDAFAACFALPQWIETFDGRRQIANRADLKALFDGVRTSFCRKGVTDLVRRCVAARWHDANTIEATHETRLLAGAQLLHPSYPCLTILTRGPAGWQIAGGQYAVSDALFDLGVQQDARPASSPSSHTGV